MSDVSEYEDADGRTFQMNDADAKRAGYTAKQRAPKDKGRAPKNKQATPAAKPVAPGANK